MKITSADTMATLIDKFNELVDFVQPIESAIRENETLAQYLTRVMNTALEQVNIARREGTPRLASFPYILEPTSTGQTEFEIPLTTFDANTDTVLIFRNRTALSTADYTILPSLSKFKIVLVEPVQVPSDTSLFVVILKNVPVGEDGPIDASLTIKSGTVTKDKIDPTYKEELDTNIKSKADNSFVVDLSNVVTDMIGALNITPSQLSPITLQSLVKLYAHRVKREVTFSVENVPEVFRNQVIVMLDILDN